MTSKRFQSEAMVRIPSFGHFYREPAPSPLQRDDLIRMKAESPSGRPQMVSSAPFETRSLWTVKANQLVPARVVAYSG